MSKTENEPLTEFVRQIFRATREQMTREEFKALLTEFEEMIDSCDCEDCHPREEEEEGAETTSLDSAQNGESRSAE